VFVAPACAASCDVESIVDLPDALTGLPGGSSRQAGRATFWTWRPDWAPDAGLHVRQYAHGGALGRIWGTAFPGAGRMLNELRVTDLARRAGVPVPAPVALRIARAFGPLVQAHIITERIPDAVNMLDWCRTSPAGPHAELMRNVAAAVRLMHDAGIVHTDLNLKNVLVRTCADGPEVFIVDFDKARCTSEVPESLRTAALQRLWRSIRKWPASRAVLTDEDEAEMRRAYGQTAH
jgi:Lipopolysaccharide kinase (Kdo/WaaP) family